MSSALKNAFVSISKPAKTDSDRCYKFCRIMRNRSSETKASVNVFEAA